MGRYEICGRWYKRQNAQGSRHTKTSPDLSDGIRTKATRQPRLAGDRSSNGQFLEHTWNVGSQLLFS